MKQRPPSYFDAWLVAFLALMVAASVIAAHGAYIFFSYLLDWWVAALATAVTAVGIPALDAAGTLEPRRGRAALYWLGALVFLAMETLANYFSGQAVFLANVLEAFAGKDGADLVWLAQQPAGRVLVVIYLAMPSLIVAYFAYAAASRWRMIHEVRATFANRSRRSTELRALVVRLARAVRGLRDELADVRGAYTRLASERTREATDLREQMEQARAKAREAQAEVAKLREQSREPSIWPASEPPTRTRVVAYAREQVESGRRHSEVARELGFADATLRGWMEASNGVELLN